MSQQHRSGWCARCQRQVVVFRPGANHILHLLLTLVTCALWLIVWLGSAIRFGGWRCSVCGSNQVSNVH